MRLKILLPVALVLGVFAVQPVLSNAAYAQTSSTTATMKAPAKKGHAKKKVAAKKKKPAAKKTAAAKKAPMKTTS